MGEARVVTTLCRLLAEAEKDRSADNMICAARTHPGLGLVEIHRELMTAAVR